MTKTKKRLNIFLCGIAVFIFCLCGCFCSLSSSFAYAQDELVSAFNAGSQSSGENYTYEICDTSFSNDGTHESTFLCVESGDNVLVSNCVFDGATSAAIVVNGGTLTLDGCTIQNSSSLFSFAGQGICSSIFVKAGVLNLCGGTSVSKITNNSDASAVYSCLVAKDGTLNVQDASIEGGESDNDLAVANFGTLNIEQSANFGTSKILNAGTSTIANVTQPIENLVTCGSVTFTAGIPCEKITLWNGEGFAPTLDFGNNVTASENLVFDWMDITNVETHEETGIVTFTTTSLENPSILDCVVGISTCDMSSLVEILNSGNTNSKCEWRATNNNGEFNLKLSSKGSITITYFDQENYCEASKTYNIVPRDGGYDIEINNGEITCYDIDGFESINYEFENDGYIYWSVNNAAQSDTNRINKSSSTTVNVQDDDGDGKINLGITIMQQFTVTVYSGFGAGYGEFELWWDYSSVLDMYLEGDVFKMSYRGEEFEVYVESSMYVFSMLQWGGEVYQYTGYNYTQITADGQSVYPGEVLITFARWTSSDSSSEEYTINGITVREAYSDIPEEYLIKNTSEFPSSTYSLHEMVMVLYNNFGLQIIVTTEDVVFEARRNGGLDLELYNHEVLYEIYVAGFDLDNSGGDDAKHLEGYIQSIEIKFAEDCGATMGPYLDIPRDHYKGCENISYRGYEWSCCSYVYDYTYPEYEGYYDCFPVSYFAYYFPEIIVHTYDE